MKSSTAFAIAAAAISAANASPSYKFPIQRRITSGARISANTGPVAEFSVAGGNASDSDISNLNDISYTTRITVCGQAFTCLLDTGSTDLWVKPSSPLSGTKDTGKTAKIVYGSGDVAGPIHICPVTMGSYSIPQQAFIDITSGNVQNLFIQNIFGIIGLGFDSLSKVNGAFPGSDTTGRSLLTNLFYANPKTPNYVAFLLDRASDLDEVAEGSFTVGELESQYASVMQQPAIKVFPDANVARWNVVLDGLSVNGANIPLKSSVNGAPAGKTIALLDTGTSLVYGPGAAVEAIYKAIPGSSFSQEKGYWLVDCMSTSTVEFNFLGTKIVIHPLDLTMVMTVNLANGTVGSTCAAAIRTNTIDAGAGELDWLLGDTFLRNAYSVFDFGDLAGETGGLVGHPFVKLLPLPASAPAKAVPEFKTARSFALSKLPPAVEPVALTGFAQQDDPNGDQGAGQSEAATLAALGQDMNKVVGYLPIVLGLLGANVLVVFVLLIVGCVFFFKRRGGGKGRTYSPVTH